MNAGDSDGQAHGHRSAELPPAPQGPHFFTPDHAALSLSAMICVPLLY